MLLEKKNTKKPWSKGENVKINISRAIFKWNRSNHFRRNCLPCPVSEPLNWVRPTHTPWHQEWEFPGDRTDKSEMLPSDHFTWPISEVQIWNLFKTTSLIFLFYFIKTMIPSSVIWKLFEFLPKSVYSENCNFGIPNKHFASWTGSCILSWQDRLWVGGWLKMVIILDIFSKYKCSVDYVL